MRAKTTEEIEEFDERCREKGCSDKAAARHTAFFKDNWDVHPPADFVRWLRLFEPNATNVVSAWNSDPCRQRYLEWKAIGEPDPPPAVPVDVQKSLDCLRAFRESMARNFNTERGAIVTEDTRGPSW